MIFVYLKQTLIMDLLPYLLVEVSCFINREI